MKKKTLIITGIIISILVIIGLFTSYVDSARVRNGVEPKHVIKIITDGGNKVTYWGLGYKVVRYPSVSPKENFKSSIGVKYGSWFMNYKLSNHEDIEVELLTEGKTIIVSRTRDIEFIVSLLRDLKYINELCEGINTHKIKIEDEIYFIKESCKEIQKGSKQAELSTEDLKRFLEIVDYYNNTEISNAEQHKFIGKIIKVYDNYIIVEPEEGTSERKSSDRIKMNKVEPAYDPYDSLYVVGNKVEITYNGNINESYPAQIHAISIDMPVIKINK